MASISEAVQSESSTSEDDLLGRHRNSYEDSEDSDDDGIPNGLKRGAISVRGWTLSYGTLYPSPALREEVSRLRSAEGEQALTHVTFRECGRQHSVDVCVGPLRMRRLAPTLLHPKYDIELQLHEDEMQHFLIVLESYLLLNEINIENFPPVFLAVTKKYDLLPLHFAHLEMLVDCSPDYEFRLPVFLHEYDFVLQLLGDLLPHLFWAHIARRIALEFDESLCSVGLAPVLWKQYPFHREGGAPYANLWQLLHNLDLVHVMFNFAFGLRCRHFPHVLNFMVTRCVDFDSGEVGTMNEYLQLLLKLDWTSVKPLVRRCVELGRRWPDKARRILRQSLCNSPPSDLDDICAEICFRVELPTKQKGLQVLYKDCGATFNNLTLALKAVVDGGRFYIDIMLRREHDARHDVASSLGANESNKVSLRLVGLECDCVCEMRRFSREQSACEYWAIYKEHDELLFTARHPKKRILLMKNVENDWFQFHSDGCSLMMNVSLRWLGVGDCDRIEMEKVLHTDTYLRE